MNDYADEWLRGGAKHLFTRELNINQDGLGKDPGWFLVSTWSLSPVTTDKVLNLARSLLAQK